MSDFTLQLELRNDTGKGSSRRLRRLADKVPAILYGAGKDPVNLSMPHNKIKHALEKPAFYSSIITLDIDGKQEKAVLKAVQRHPAKPKILHLDFLRVTGKESITMMVPFTFMRRRCSSWRQRRRYHFSYAQ